MAALFPPCPPRLESFRAGGHLFRLWGFLRMYLITTAITTNKIIAAVVALVVIVAVAFFWMRSRRSAA